jgi:LPXTG-site transpeptidase (sortase) family protein
MQPLDAPRRTRRSERVLRWTQRLLIAGGLAMLTWTALIVGDGSLAQWQARRALGTATDSLAADAEETPVAAPPEASHETTPAARPASPADVRSRTSAARRARPSLLGSGSAIAELSIPRVDLSAVVLQGSDLKTLRRGPGHVENTALPGEGGNVVIAGHRDSFFRPLRDVKLGDDVFLKTPHGRLHYRVTSLQVVTPRDVDVLEPTETPTLTLITCYPFWVLGNAPDRYVVRATRVGEPVASAWATATSDAVPAAHAGAASPGSDASSLEPRIPSHLSLPRQAEAAEAALNAPATAAVASRGNRARAETPGNKVVPRDDTKLVRWAIERFRLTYNARLFTHNDARPPLQFESCDVTVSDEQATATCAGPVLATGDGQRPVWTLVLRRVERDWAIKTIEAND